MSAASYPVGSVIAALAISEDLIRGSLDRTRKRGSAWYTKIRGFAQTVTEAVLGEKDVKDPKHTR